jgi:hypothetical protein
MIARWLVVAAGLVLVCLAVGCGNSNDNRSVEPTLAKDTAIDPRLKPTTVSGGNTIDSEQPR